MRTIMLAAFAVAKFLTAMNIHRNDANAVVGGRGPHRAGSVGQHLWWIPAGQQVLTCLHGPRVYAPYWSGSPPGLTFVCKLSGRTVTKGPALS